MLNDNTSANNPVLRLKRIGEREGCYCTYYRDISNGDSYVVVDFRGVRMWHTAICDFGEPDCPLKDGLILEIEENGSVVRCERIIRVSDCTSIGKGYSKKQMEAEA